MRRLIYPIHLIGIMSLAKYGASVSFTNENFNGIQAGVPFNITWEGAQGAVVLALLFKTNASSPQNSTIIATGITESLFTWIPPDWTTNVFAQKIEAQDSKNNFALSGNFSIAKAARATTSMQEDSNAVTTSVSSSMITTTASHAITSTPPSPKTTEPATRKGNDTNTKIRIGFGIGIVVVLIIIGVALLFFEHGKRVAARSEQQQRPKQFEGAERGLVDLELVERNFAYQKKNQEDAKHRAPATPLLYKPYRKPKSTMELEGIAMKQMKKMKNETEEERKKRILSMRSIYELG